MKRIQLLLFILTLLLYQGCKEAEIIDRTPLDFFIGQDTTIACGDTLYLDAGAGYDSYLWYNGISTNQTLAVTDPGPYWVRVTRGGRVGIDTILIDSGCTSVVPCDTLVNFFYQTLEIPCSYSYLYGIGDDSRSIDIRSGIQDIVLEYERGIIEPDTIFQLPEIYKKWPTYTYDHKLLISDRNNREVGVLYFSNIGGPFRNIDGCFLVKQSHYYLEMMNPSFSSYKINKVVNILSTIKPIE